MKPFYVFLALLFPLFSAGQTPVLREILTQNQPDTTQVFDQKIEFSYSKNGREELAKTFRFIKNAALLDLVSKRRQRFDDQNRLIEAVFFYENLQTGVCCSDSSVARIQRDPLGKTMHIDWLRDGYVTDQLDSVFDQNGRLVHFLRATRYDTVGPFWPLHEVDFEYFFDADGKLEAVERLENGWNALDQYFYDPTVSDSVVLILYSEKSPTAAAWNLSGVDSFFYDADRRLARKTRRCQLNNPCGDFRENWTRFYEWSPSGQLVRTRWVDFDDPFMSSEKRIEYDSKGREKAQSFLYKDDSWQYHRAERVETRWSENGRKTVVQRFKDSLTTDLGAANWRFLSREDFVYDDPPLPARAADFEVEARPNPAFSHVFFQSDAFFGQKIEWRAFDNLGRKRAEGSSDGNRRWFDADILGLEAGVYFFFFEGENGARATVRVVVGW